MMSSITREFKKLSHDGWEDVRISTLEPGDVICIYDGNKRYVDEKGNNTWIVEKFPYLDTSTGAYYVEVLEDYGDSVLV